MKRIQPYYLTDATEYMDMLRHEREETRADQQAEGRDRLYTCEARDLRKLEHQTDMAIDSAMQYGRS